MANVRELPNENSKPRGLLNSWKEIAEVLGVTVRTAQAWEKTRELPVRRMGTRVCADANEIRAWQAASLTRRRFWQRSDFLRWWAIGATALGLAVVGVAGWYAWNRFLPGEPVRAVYSGTLLTAFDGSGKTAWQRPFELPAMLENHPSIEWGPMVVDVNGDRQRETILCYHHSRREVLGWDLLCLSHRGQDLWRLSESRTVATGEGTYSPPYVLREFVVFPSPEKDGTQWTAAVFVHLTAYPAVLLVVDGQGRPRGEFWQAGHFNALTSMDLDGDGTQELLAAGVQHGVEQAVLQILDPRDLHGAAPLLPADCPRQFRDMPIARPRATVYFPRTDLNRKFEAYNYACTVRSVNGCIQVEVREQTSHISPGLIWTLKTDLSVSNLSVSQSFQIGEKQAGLAERPSLSSAAELEAFQRLVRVVRP